MQKRKASEISAFLAAWEGGGPAEGGAARLRFADGFRPRKMCTFFLEGRCQRGEACTYAHALEELDSAAAKLQPMEAATRLDVDTPLATGAEEELTQACPSILLGPREFPADSPPGQLCPFWMHHPACCEQGDTCLMAHGLAELGLEFGDPVEIRTDGGQSDANRASTNGSMDIGLSAKMLTTRRTTGAADGWRMPEGTKGARMALPMGEDGCRGKGGMGMVNMVERPAPTIGPASGNAIVPPAGMQQNRFAGSGFMPMKVCNFWVRDPNACTKGINCSFAHGVHELQPSAVATCGISRFHHTARRPTKYCTFYANGTCTRGLLCTFAHSPEEMQGTD